MSQRDDRTGGASAPPTHADDALDNLERALEGFPFRDTIATVRDELQRREWETPGNPMNDWTRREPILRKIDALLADCPDGGGAK